MGRWRAFSLIVIAAVLAAVAFTSRPAVAGSDSAAWCYDGSEWLGYAADIPGSASQDQFTACLEAGALRGEVAAFPGQVLEDRVLIELGGALFSWRSRQSRIGIRAFGDRIEFEDACDGRIEVRGNSVSILATGCRLQRVWPDRDLTDPDFTIFVTRQSFVIDGTDGWYHVGALGREGSAGDSSSPSSITLVRGEGGIWVTADHEVVNGSWHFFYEPISGSSGDPQEHRVIPWLSRVHRNYIPDSFDDAGSFLLPDRQAYWDNMQEWIWAILQDLYHDRAEAMHVAVMDHLTGGAYSEGRRHNPVATPSVDRLLGEIASVIAEAEQPHGPRYVGTRLMLWNRYVPDFDNSAVVRLAERYAIEIGTPVAVEPESSRTLRVRELLGRSDPLLLSDDRPIDPMERLSEITLEVGKEYTALDWLYGAHIEAAPYCVVEEQDSSGGTYTVPYRPQAKLTIGDNDQWNGLSLLPILDVQDLSTVRDWAVLVVGTPRVAGRVLVEVTTLCPGGQRQSPRLLGYGEIVVVDPAAE